MNKITWTIDNQHQRCAIYKLAGFSHDVPLVMLEEVIQTISSELASRFGVEYRESLKFIPRENRPSWYWGEITGTQEQINWLLLHL